MISLYNFFRAEAAAVYHDFSVLSANDSGARQAGLTH